MRSIGFDDSQIALSGVLVSAAMVVLQTPAGILADRWSRKGTLILASSVLALSTIVGGMSQDVFTFYIASVLWGAFAAISFGTYVAVVYDTLKEEEDNSNDFERYYGWLRFYYGVALISGSLLSGLVGELFGLRAAFWLSIPAIIFSILALLKFKEPLVHKAHAREPIIQHTKQTVMTVMQKGHVFWIITPLILLIMLARLLDNLSQLWYLAFALPVVFWGPAYALLHISASIAGPIAWFVKSSRFKILSLAGLTIMVSMSLVFDSSALSVIVAQALLLTSYGVLVILLSHQLQDTIAPNVRAGANSAVGTLAQLVFLPTAYIFGWLSQTYTVFQAAWVIVIITATAMIIFCLKVLPMKQTFAVDKKDINEATSHINR